MTALLIILAVIAFVAAGLAGSLAIRRAWRGWRIGRQQLLAQQQLDFLTFAAISAMRAAARRHAGSGGDS